MHHYRHILVASDLRPDSDKVIARAVELARHYNAHLSLMHVVEIMPVDLAGEPAMPHLHDLEQQLQDIARQRMEQLSGEFKLANATREVRIGSAKLDVLNYADEKAVDLIVIGNHSRHGLARLLGSTASALLHYAPCDILTVHLGED